MLPHFEIVIHNAFTHFKVRFILFLSVLIASDQHTQTF